VGIGCSWLSGLHAFGMVVQSLVPEIWPCVQVPSGYEFLKLPETSGRRKWCVICVVCVVSDAGWLMSAPVGGQRVWGRSLPERLLRLTAPIDRSCCKAAPMRWMDMRRQQVWTKVEFCE
jgi:hypothetical protein